MVEFDQSSNHVAKLRFDSLDVGSITRGLTSILGADVRAVVLAGSERHSWSGRKRESDSSEGQGNHNGLFDAQRKLYELMSNCPVPIIAAVRGSVSDEGFQLALACHLRVAERETNFKISKTGLRSLESLGLPPDLTIARACLADASEMLARDGMDADSAHRVGFVNQLVETDADLAAQELARKIVEYSAPLAVKACLEAVINASRLSEEEGMKREVDLFADLFSTADAREGTRAFIERRQPKFLAE